MSCSQIPSDFTIVSQLVHVACSNALQTPSPSSVCRLWGNAKSSQMHPNVFYFGDISFHPLLCVFRVIPTPSLCVLMVISPLSLCIEWFLFIPCVCWGCFLLLQRYFSTLELSANKILAFLISFSLVCQSLPSGFTEGDLSLPCVVAWKQIDTVVATVDVRPQVATSAENSCC